MMIRINEAARYSFMQVRFAGRFYRGLTKKDRPDSRGEIR